MNISPEIMKIEMKTNKLKRKSKEKVKPIVEAKKEPEYCHSFWRSECVNRNIECYRCSFWYSNTDKPNQ